MTVPPSSCFSSEHALQVGVCRRLCGGDGGVTGVTGGGGGMVGEREEKGAYRNTN